MEIGTTPSRAGAVAFLTLFWGIIVIGSVFIEYLLWLIEPSLIWGGVIALMVVGLVFMAVDWCYSNKKWKRNVSTMITAIAMFSVCGGGIAAFLNIQEFRKAVMVVIFLAVIAIVYSWATKTLKNTP